MSKWKNTAAWETAAITLCRRFFCIYLKPYLLKNWRERKRAHLFEHSTIFLSIYSFICIRPLAVSSSLRTWFDFNSLPWNCYDSRDGHSKFKLGTRIEFCQDAVVEIVRTGWLSKQKKSSVNRYTSWGVRYHIGSTLILSRLCDRKSQRVMLW